MLLILGKVINFEIWRRVLLPEEAVSNVNLAAYDRAAFDKLSRKIKKVGKFSEEKKSLYDIRRDLIDLSNLDYNGFLIKNQQKISTYNSNQLPDSPEYNIHDLVPRSQFTKIATVNISSINDKNKFLTVIDRNNVFLSFIDKTIKYGESYEYYVVAISKELGKSTKSESISITVEDLSLVVPPKISVKQTRETSVELSILLEPSSFPDKVLIFRKAETDLNFIFLAEANVLKDSLILVDDVTYGINYTYRVFVKNVHGMLSEPAEVTFFSSVQKVTPQSKSNDLKIPIFSAVQDQNSDFIKISIFPNDFKVSYYVLERRDLTKKEKKFTVPSKVNTNYGGSGWRTNVFFVEKTRETIQSSDISYLSKTTFSEIEFIDDIIQENHIYQYRVRGYDIFGNGTAYSFELIKSQGKKNIRTPINIRKETLRQYPLRVKISWDDDNVLSNTEDSFNANNPALVKDGITYKVERRKINEVNYESFPVTKNNFIVDEVPTIDAININGEELVSSEITTTENLSLSPEQIEQSSKIRRSFKLPSFLKENDTYFYKIKAIYANRRRK